VARHDRPAAPSEQQQLRRLHLGLLEEGAALGHERQHAQHAWCGQRRKVRIGQQGTHAAHKQRRPRTAELLVARAAAVAECGQLLQQRSAQAGGGRGHEAAQVAAAQLVA
jgi:hypothetical protein